MYILYITREGPVGNGGENHTTLHNHKRASTSVLVPCRLSCLIRPHLVTFCTDLSQTGRHILNSHRVTDSCCGRPTRSARCVRLHVWDPDRLVMLRSNRTGHPRPPTCSPTGVELVVVVTQAPLLAAWLHGCGPSARLPHGVCRYASIRPPAGWRQWRRPRL